MWKYFCKIGLLAKRLLGYMWPNILVFPHIRILTTILIDDQMKAVPSIKGSQKLPLNLIPKYIILRVQNMSRVGSKGPLCFWLIDWKRQWPQDKDHRLSLFISCCFHVTIWSCQHKVKGHEMIHITERTQSLTSTGCFSIGPFAESSIMCFWSHHPCFGNTPNTGSIMHVICNG